MKAFNLAFKRADVGPDSPAIDLENPFMNALVCRTFSLVVFALLVFVQGCASRPAREFASPDQAVDSLVQAMRDHDRNELAGILGGDSKGLLESGDPVADRNGADHFVAMYDARHSITQEAEGSSTLVVGENDWPMPIPIIKNKARNAWSFDTAAGKDEIINRRVGRNELATVQVCLAIADAQEEYALEDRDGNGVRDYARKFLSDPGKKNGLYWPTNEGEPPSPLGPLVAGAKAEGYGTDSDRPRAYHGYRYRVLTCQGPNADGGELDYVANGKMIGGFAAVAYPIEYGKSGIMTFIVNHKGVVFERDLGSNTRREAETMRAFNPGPGWRKVESFEAVEP